MTAPKNQVIHFIPVNDIIVLDGRRDLNEGAVNLLMESIKEIGLQTPISVRLTDVPNSETGELEQDFVLVTGRHRLEAFKRLGKTEIPCIERECSDIDAELEEIAENLHRTDLTALERDEHIAKWIRLTEERRQVAQNEPAVLKDGRKAGHQHQESGIRAAARHLGIERNDARRSKKTANLSDEAKNTAREVGLDDNRSALLKAAAHKDNPRLQVETLRSIAEAKASHSEEQQRSSAALKVAQAIADYCPPKIIPQMIEHLRDAGAQNIAKALKQIG